ncbi:MAG: bifunctional molybdenum cofactor biosynthesis protein MoaC/MoaB [Deltaproteobacteria bacterium]|nr:bifunctional molybdenum cofactor biosynthesis protein MoaC/MoaB [Deltaproteobacteria bacterium]
MFFTDNKIETFRTAVAESVITMSLETLKRVKEKTTPKGDVLELARTAGVLAAKKTPELIPYCHPLPLDGVRIDFEFLEKNPPLLCKEGAGEVDNGGLPHPTSPQRSSPLGSKGEESGIRIRATVKTIWKTGVEMEALTAVTIAALTIYDMCKPIDKEMEIITTRLIEKSGGKSDFQEKIPKDLRAAVVVTSDGTAKGTREDKSGKIIRERLAKLGIAEIQYVVLPDEKEQIKKELLALSEKGFHLIVTTGGTGFGPRDVTVEATREVIDREAPGIAEAMRQFGQKRTPYAMLSRGLAGLKGNTVIVNLPGSSRGTTESLDAIFPAVLHSYKMMGGGGH